MKLLITGASGFLGRHVVAESLERGHDVRALVRPASRIEGLGWVDDPRVELARADLRNPRGLTEVVDGMDAVLHLAADKGGDLYSQLGGTVVATENLLHAMGEAGVGHIVLTSSFAVYEYRRRWTFGVIDEDAPLESRPEERDAYCQTKMMQEKLVIDHASEHGWTWTVLRPGVIFGPENTWTARIGMQLSERRWLRTGAWARLPLSHVEHCAEAVVLATEREEAAGKIINVHDDDMPTQRRYARLLRHRLDPAPRILPVAWSVVRLLAGCAWLFNSVALGGRAKLPGLLIPARLHARCKPMRYDNSRLKRVLGWKPRYQLTEAIERSVKGDKVVTASTPSKSEKCETEVAGVS